MSADDVVQVTIEDRVAIVSLQCPDGQNRFSTAVMQALRDCATDLAGRSELAAVVLHGQPVFSAGVDVSALRADDAPGLVELRERLKLGPALCKAWEDIEAYTIAAIEGYCVGGAAALAAALDHRVMGASAFFRLPEVPLGINMSWHALPRLVAQIGPARTKQYVMLGRRISAEQAQDWGLCEDIVADGDTLVFARALAEELKALPPLPLRMTKHSVNAIANALTALGSHMDRDQFLLTLQTRDFAEGLAAFREKRAPRFRGD